jgi:hypothetical protein
MVNEMSGAATTVRSDPLAVANRLRPVLLQLARELRREVHPLGITGGQVALLSALRRHPGAGVRELAAREGVSADSSGPGLSRARRMRAAIAAASGSS